MKITDGNEGGIGAVGLGGPEIWFDAERFAEFFADGSQIFCGVDFEGQHVAGAEKSDHGTAGLLQKNDVARMNLAYGAMRFLLKHDSMVFLPAQMCER